MLPKWAAIVDTAVCYGYGCICMPVHIQCALYTVYKCACMHVYAILSIIAQRQSTQLEQLKKERETKERDKEQRELWCFFFVQVINHMPYTHTNTNTYRQRHTKAGSHTYTHTHRQDTRNMNIAYAVPCMCPVYVNCVLRDRIFTLNSQMRRAVYWAA